MNSTEEVYKKISQELINKGYQNLDNEAYFHLKTEESKNNVFSDYFNGFKSYPESWWATTIQLLAINGILGKHQKHFAVIRQSIFSSLIHTALNDWHRTGRVMLWVVKRTIKQKKAYTSGRITSGALINTLIFKKRKTE